MNKPLAVVMADDDADDREMARLAFAENPIANPIEFASDGQELLDLLRSRRADGLSDPALVLLDLNMPNVDGRQALAEMKADPALRHVPVVILTTSRAEEDIIRSYDLGASGFISKPVTFDGLVKVVDGLGRYWFELVAQPSG